MEENNELSPCEVLTHDKMKYDINYQMGWNAAMGFSWKEIERVIVEHYNAVKSNFPQNPSISDEIQEKILRDYEFLLERLKGINISIDAKGT